jgi:hypothetical protein
MALLLPPVVDLVEHAGRRLLTGTRLKEWLPPGVPEAEGWVVHLECKLV